MKTFTAILCALLLVFVVNQQQNVAANIFRDLKHDFEHFGHDVAHGVKDAAHDVAHVAKNGADDVAHVAKTAVGGVGKVAKEGASDVGHGVKTAAGDVAHVAVNAAHDAARIAADVQNIANSARIAASHIESIVEVVVKDALPYIDFVNELQSCAKFLETIIIIVLH